MTVIYSNYLDDDCKILQEMWKGFYNIRVVEITPSSKDYEDIINNSISNEEDTLILCGHGTSYGLLFPNMEKGEYLIHENNVHLIKAKNIICCWCYASNFVIDHPELKNCFATSMFISNIQEAYDNGIMNCSQEEINKNSKIFNEEINWLFKNNVPLNEWVMRLGAHMNIENPVDVFNRQCLHYQ